MPGHVAYRLLAAVTALFFALLGMLFVTGFIDRALFQVFARPLFDTDVWGYYLLGVAGSALIAWAACLVAVIRAPDTTTGIATATTIGLVLGAILRLLAWYSGEYRLAGAELRLESAVLLMLALGFVWLRPAPPS